MASQFRKARRLSERPRASEQLASFTVAHSDTIKMLPLCNGTIAAHDQNIETGIALRRSFLGMMVLPV